MENPNYPVEGSLNSMLKKLIGVLIILISLIPGGSVWAQPSIPLATEKAFVMTPFSQGDRWGFLWTIAPGHYLYKDRLNIRYLNSDSNQWKPLTLEFPPYEIVDDLEFGAQKVYKHELLIFPFNQLVLNDRSSMAIEVHYQGCAKWGFCYPPQTKSFLAHIQHKKLARIEPTQATQPTASASMAYFEHESIARVCLSFFLLGIALSLTPCVLPMVPILSGILIGNQNRHHPKSPLGLSLAYVLAMALTYALAGVGAALFGKSAQAFLQTPVVITTFAALFIFLGGVQLGKWSLRLPTFLRGALDRFHHQMPQGTYWGAASMGALATLIASPCVTAPLMGALAYIAQTQDKVLGGLALFSMGFGMGMLLLVAGTLGAKWLPQKGPWMHLVNKLLAFVLWGFAIWLLERIIEPPFNLALWAVLFTIAAWMLGGFNAKKSGWGQKAGAILGVYVLWLGWGIFQGETVLWFPFKASSQIEPHPSAHFTPIHSLAKLDAQLKEAQARGQPTLIKYYASWCISCKRMEQHVFKDPKVVSLLNPWQRLLVDVSQMDAQSQALLSHYNLIAPPALIFIDSNGSELKQHRMVGEIASQEIIPHLLDLNGQFQMAEHNFP